jgi:hypothetical protein
MGYLGEINTEKRATQGLDDDFGRHVRLQLQAATVLLHETQARESDASRRTERRGIA